MFDRDYPRDTSLIGNFLTKLTLAERNEFHRFIRENSMYDEYTQLGTEHEALGLAIIGQNPNAYQRFLDVAKRRWELYEKLFDVSQAWYDEVIAPQRAAEKEENKS